MKGRKEGGRQEYSKVGWKVGRKEGKEMRGKKRGIGKKESVMGRNV
jgi:hypothetical protein